MIPLRVFYLVDIVSRFFCICKKSPKQKKEVLERTSLSEVSSGVEPLYTVLQTVT